MKTCVRCNTAKPRSAFPPRTESRDGLLSYCRHCRTEMGRLRAAAAKGRVISKDGSKPCSLCRVVKPFAEFSECAVARDGHDSACRPCAAARAKRYRQAKSPEELKAMSRRHYQKWGRRSQELTKEWVARNPERARAIRNRSQRVSCWHARMVNQTRQSAKRLGREFDLDAEFILELFEKQGRRCYWFGIEMIPSVLTRDPLRPSIDRLDPTRGYTRDNVVLTCLFANLGRSIMPEDRMRSFVAKLRIHLSGHAT